MGGTEKETGGAESRRERRFMTRAEFVALIGQDVVVDYPFGQELQRWSMKNFYVDDNGEIKHNRLLLNEEMAELQKEG